MFRNKTAVIGENQYSFDENGVATLIKGIDYGRVVVQHVDETGNPIKTDDTFVEKTELEQLLIITSKKEIAKTDFYTKIKRNTRLSLLMASKSTNNSKMSGPTTSSAKQLQEHGSSRWFIK